MATVPHYLVRDERSKALLFTIIAIQVDHPEFKFAEMLRLWFHTDENCLARYLEWLDLLGLEIRRKEK